MMISVKHFSDFSTTCVFKVILKCKKSQYKYFLSEFFSMLVIVGVVLNVTMQNDTKKILNNSTWSFLNLPVKTQRKAISNSCSVKIASLKIEIKLIKS